MSYQSKINAAIALQNEGQFLEACKIYQTLLKKKPKSFDARQLLALCYHELKQFNKSIAEFKQAIKIKPNHAATRNNFGNVYMDLGDYPNAKMQFEKAIAINPKYSVAFNNLGNCLQQTHRYELAIKAYRRAISAMPKEAEFHNNLGVALSKIGNFDDSLSALQHAHNLNPQLSSVYVHIFDLLMLMHLSGDAINIASSSIAEGILTSAETCALHIGIAINCWLMEDLVSLEFHLQASTAITQQFEHYPNVKNLRVFHQYLSKLLEFRLKNDALYQGKASNTMVMISESHGFAPAATVVGYQQETYRIKSFLVTGCKMWHLSQDKDNMYNKSVIGLFSKLPKCCTIIIGFGEIDCRVNEGIYPNFVKTGDDYHQSIKRMVQAYITAMLEAATPYGHQLIFYGVPAPHPKTIANLDTQQRIDFLDVIRVLNEQLIHECRRLDCPVLNTYALTENQKGESNLQWHLDDIHLKPQAMAILFEQYLIN